MNEFAKALETTKSFKTWLASKKTVKVLIMNQNVVIAKLFDCKVVWGCDDNDSGYPTTMEIFNSGTTANIGERYINCITESGEYWCVFVDGHEHYLFS